VEFTRTERGARVRARAGKVAPLPTAACIIAAIWTGKWLLDLAVLIVALLERKTQNSGTALFVCAVASLAGLYCAALCPWTMIGHEVLAIRNGKLYLGNPWLLGLASRGCDLRKVGAFSCADSGSGVRTEGDSSCCRWSAVDYSLNADCDGRRVPIFTQLPRGAKDWLRDRLNAVLAEHDK
jgi:hypothetical protein